jgi:hypothetical protein
MNEGRTTLVNFSHPLSKEQLTRIEQLTDAPIQRLINTPARLDPQAPFAPQTRRLVDSVGLTPEEWQTSLLVINLPSLSAAAAAVLAEVHGRCGYFPAVIRTRAGPTSPIPSFEIAEIIDLQRLRVAARDHRIPDA